MSHRYGCKFVNLNSPENCECKAARPSLSERAHQIVKKFSNPDLAEEKYWTPSDWAVAKEIESELNDAVKAAVDLAVSQAIDDIALGLREHEVTKRIRDEALEKAAQVAVNRAHGLAGEVQAAKDIAATIRALKDSQ